MNVLSGSYLSLEFLLVITSITNAVRVESLNSYTLENDYITRCGRSCDSNGNLVELFSCQTLNCYPCDCDADCALFGTCCPSDVDVFVHQNGFSNNQTDVQTALQTIKCTRLPYSTKSLDRLLIVYQCPPTWPDADVRNRCENPILDSFPSITPLSDQNTGLHFANVHCAVCNGYHSQMVPWHSEIICEHYQSLYSILDGFEFFRQAFISWKCVTEFLPGDGLKEPRQCDRAFHTRPVDWCPESSDPELMSLCRDLHSVRVHRILLYKNVYCAMCHNFTRFCVNRTGPRDKEFDWSDYMPPMTLLFGYSGPPKHALPYHNACPSTQWEGSQGVCLSPNCTEGKILDDSNNTCASAIPQIQGLGYNLTVIFTTDEEVVMSEDTFRDFYHWIVEILDVLTSEMDVDVRFRVNKTSEDRMVEGTLQSLEISGHLLANSTMRRDTFEHTMANFTQRCEDMENNPNPFNVSLYRHHLGSYIIHNLQTTTSFYQKDKFECDTEAGAVEYVFAERDANPAMLGFHRRSICQNNDLWQVVDIFIDFTPKLTCPFITFDIIGDPVVEDDRAVFTFQLRNEAVNVTSAKDVSFSDGQIHICLDYLHELTKKVTKQKYYRLFENDPITVVEYYIEVTCLCVSIAFLIFALVTYCLFPPLRSLPGLNNMCLCGSLLSAQTSLLLTSLFGIRGYFPKVYCLIHAIIFHYSWLASFLWMNICCIHMYRVFTATGSQFSDSHSDRRRHRRYCIFAFGIPAVIVAMTVGITLGATEGASPGYNDDLCFLDTFTSILIIILGLLVPFAITALANAVLFILTIREIIHVSRLTEHVGTRKSHGVIAYVKLSTLTGIFCVLAAIAVQFKSPIIAVLASPFAALQGLFIFLSFIANRHVKLLYKGLLFRKEKKKGSSFDSTHTRRTTDTGLSTQTRQNTTNI